VLKPFGGPKGQGADSLDEDRFTDRVADDGPAQGRRLGGWARCCSRNARAAADLGGNMALLDPRQNRVAGAGHPPSPRANFVSVIRGVVVATTPQWVGPVSGHVLERRRTISMWCGEGRHDRC